MAKFIGIKKTIHLHPSLTLGFFIVCQLAVFLFQPDRALAITGTRVGDCWTDWDGTNHCGESASSYSGSSSSDASDPYDYHWHYTYGYTNTASSSSGSSQSWAARMEAIREQREMEADARVHAEAVRLNAIGIEYSEKRDFEKAVEYYQKAYNTYPADQQILKNLNDARGSQWNEAGIQYFEAGSYEQAAQAYQQALASKPDSEIIRQNLAQVQGILQQQRDAEAARQRERAEIAAAKGNIQEKLNKFSKEFAELSGGNSGLSFKGDAVAGPANLASVRGGQTAAALEFKGLGMQDSSVVDLRDKKTMVVDPAMVSGTVSGIPKPGLKIHEPPPPAGTVKGPEFDPELDRLLTMPRQPAQLPTGREIEKDSLEDLMRRARTLPPDVNLFDFLPDAPMDTGLEYASTEELLRRARTLPPDDPADSFFGALPLNQPPNPFDEPLGLTLLEDIPVPPPAATPDLVDLVAPGADKQPPTEERK